MKKLFSCVVALMIICLTSACAFAVSDQDGGIKFEQTIDQFVDHTTVADNVNFTNPIEFTVYRQVVDVGDITHIMEAKITIFTGGEAVLFETESNCSYIVKYLDYGEPVSIGEQSANRGEHILYYRTCSTNSS